MNSRGSFLAGLSAGALVTLILAPQAGKKTQKLISQKAQKGLDQVKAAAMRADCQIKDWVQTGEEQLTQTLETVRKL